MVLSDATIRELTKSVPPLLNPFQEGCLKPASYDLTVGREYYLYQPNHGSSALRAPVVDSLRKGGSFAIYPNGVCFILTEERVALPRDLSGSLSLPLGLIKQGVVLARQPSLDPGYQGYLVAMLYNLSNKEVLLRRGDHLLSVEFHILDRPAEEDYPEESDAKYMGLSTLSDLLDRPLVSTLQGMREEISSVNQQMSDWKNQVFRYLTIILTVLTVLIAVMTLLSAFRGGDFRPDEEKTKSHLIETQLDDITRRLQALEDIQSASYPHTANEPPSSQSSSTPPPTTTSGQASSDSSPPN